MSLIKKLLDEFGIKAVLSYARARVPQNYLGPTLFPVETTNELTFEYFKDANQLPVMASVQAYGAETPIASRRGISKVSGEIPPIKRKIPMGERELLALKREGLGDYEMVRNNIFNDLDQMVDAVNMRIEKMRMDAVSGGKIVLNEQNIIMDVDYGVPGDLQESLLTTNMWSNTTASNPIEDIQEWAQAVVDYSGVKPTRALTSSKIVNYLIKNENIRKMIRDSANLPVTLADINALLNTMDLPAIATYNLMYKTEAEDGTITSGHFFPRDKFVMMPSVALGNTLIGPTAEALLNPEVEARDMSGIFAQVYQENDPPVLWTKASATSIPTFPMADSVFIATPYTE